MIKIPKKTIIIILLVICVVIGLLSIWGMISDLFDGVFEILDSSNIPGGTVKNNNPFSAKKIKSDKLVYFYAKFYLETRYEDEQRYEESGGYPEEARGYIFEVKTEKDGKITIKEDYYEPISCETDESIFTELQKIIEDYDLVKINGIYTYTQGLPPEFSPSSLEAIYDSGEKLSLIVNNNPYADWSSDIAQVLMDELRDQGVLEMPE